MDAALLAEKAKEGIGVRLAEEDLGGRHMMRRLYKEAKRGGGGEHGHCLTIEWGYR